MRAFLASLSLTLVFLPRLAFAQEPAAIPATPSSSLSSYELFYPIVAGKVRGDSLYFLKSIRERVVALLIFDDIRKSDYHLVLSKKRLVEAEKLLLEREDYKSAEATIKKSLAELTTAINTAERAEGKGRKVRDIYNALSTESEKEASFLKDLISKVPESERQPFAEITDVMGKLSLEIQSHRKE